MPLIVDFNMRTDQGQYPSLIAGMSDLNLGDRVVAIDGEGTQCSAIIEEITHDGRLAMLSPIGDTWAHVAAGHAFPVIA